MKKRANPYKHIMIINGILAIVVFSMVFIFLYLSFKFKRDANKEVNYANMYRIEVSKDFQNDSLSVYVNDSLLLNQRISAEGAKAAVKRTAEQSVLMVVDNVTEKTAFFNLQQESRQIIVKKEGEETVIVEH